MITLQQAIIKYPNALSAVNAALGCDALNNIPELQSAYHLRDAMMLASGGRGTRTVWQKTKDHYVNDTKLSASMILIVKKILNK